MKQYLLKAAGAGMLVMLAFNGALAQDKNPDKNKLKEEDLLVIKPGSGKDTKLTIEIKDGNVKVNGKALSEFKDDNVTITRRKDMGDRNLAETYRLYAPQSRFRGGAWNFSNDDLSKLKAPGASRAFLGVSTEKADEAGAQIKEVTEESAADKAGLKEGDIITGVNDAKIKNPEDLVNAIGKMKPDDKVKISFLRDKKEQQVTATLGKRKGAMALVPGEGLPFRDFNFIEPPLNGTYNFSWNSRGRLGIKAQETEDGKGVKVLDVDDDSPADKAGLKEGDIITELDGKKVDNVDVLRDAAQKAMEKKSFKISYIRDGRQQEAEIKLPKNLKTANL
jgi:serine protease Do